MGTRLSNNLASSSGTTDSDHTPVKTLTLAVAALGVVFGDIGTSPLYTLKECFHGSHAIPLTETNVYGVMSLIFWSLIIVVSIKYVIVLLLADHDGEGGIFALMGLVSDETRKISARTRAFVVGAGILGAALLCGDGIITPAISVLSAVEGLEVAQRPNVPGILRLAENLGLRVDPQETTFYLGRVTLLTTGNAKMMGWRKALFSMMLRMAGSPAVYFGLPANRVVELGAQIEL